MSVATCVSYLIATSRPMRRVFAADNCNSGGFAQWLLSVYTLGLKGRACANLVELAKSPILREGSTDV